MNEENWKAGNPKAAFPVYAKDDGMTLRDYLAAAALPIMVGRGDLNHNEIAEHAYKTADAMLKEGGATNDTQRLDWLARNPERLLVHYRAVGSVFSILIEKGVWSREPDKWTNPRYSPEYETLREALDEGMKRVL